MTIHWTREALGDLRNIVKYIDVRNPQAALRVKQKIMITSRQLKEFPQSGMAVHRPGMRRLVVSGLPYILIYHVVSNAIYISAVIDARMERAPDLQ